MLQYMCKIFINYGIATFTDRIIRSFQHYACLVSSCKAYNFSVFMLSYDFFLSSTRALSPLKCLGKLKVLGNKFESEEKDFHWLIFVGLNSL